MGLDDASRSFEAAGASALAEDASNLRTQGSSTVSARPPETWSAWPECTKHASRPGRSAPHRDLYTKAAQIRGVHLDHSEIAIGHYRKVLGSTSRASMPPARSSGSSESRRATRISPHLHQKGDHAPRFREQKAYFYRAATLYEETLERPEDAIGVLAKILEIDPEEFRAIDKQIELYLGLEQWEPLLRRTTTRPTSSRLRGEAQALHGGRRGLRASSRHPRAIDTYQRILEARPRRHDRHRSPRCALSGDVELAGFAERARTAGGPRRRSVRGHRLSVPNRRALASQAR